jgi:hypothetical protein
MSTLAEKRKEVKDKFKAIKNTINNEKDSFEDRLKAKTDEYKKKVTDFNKKLEDIDSSAEDLQKKYGAKIGEFTSDLKKKLPNPDNIFEKISSDLKDFFPVKPKDGESLLRKHTRTAIHRTADSIKPIVLENIRKLFFTSDVDSSCGATTPMRVDSLTLRPDEFDFLDVLKTDPQSGLGKIMYEGASTNDRVQMNKQFYGAFGTPYTFTALDETQLFNITWDSAYQRYNISGLQGGGATTVDQFIQKYFEGIEFPKLSDVFKNTLAMMMPIGGLNSTNGSYDVNTNILMKFIEKIMGDCGSPQKNLNQNAVSQINENDIDPEFFFDFDALEGIDLDDELRYRKVMRFKDCNNYEMPVDQRIIENFAFLSSTKTDITELFNNTLQNTAKAAANNNLSIPYPQFMLNLDFSALLMLPKALIATVFSPKIFFPFVVLWKMFKAAATTVAIKIKDLLKNIAKTVFKIIKDIFNKFLTTFWLLIKPEIAKILKDLAMKIMKNSKSKYRKLIRVLIDLLTGLIPFIGIGCCDDLYNALLVLFNQLNVGFQSKIPGLLLLMADKLPGFSKDRAAIEINQEMEKAGIPTGDQFCQPTNVKDFVGAVVSGHSNEFFKNTKVNIAMKPSPIAVAPLGGSGFLTPENQGVGVLT